MIQNENQAPEGQSETSTDSSFAKFLDWEFCFHSKKTQLDLKAKGIKEVNLSTVWHPLDFSNILLENVPN